LAEQPAIKTCGSTPAHGPIEAITQRSTPQTIFTTEFTMAQTILNSRGWTVDGTTRGRWTLLGDTVFAATEGITTAAGTINTLSGNDNLLGTVTTGTGTEAAHVAGVMVMADTRLNLGFGDDQIIGEAPVVADSFNFGVDNEGALDTGYGNDTIKGISRFGVYNGYTGSITTGEGNDKIIGESSDAGGGTSDFGLINHGYIFMGAGRDSITASKSTNGIFNDKTIQMGDGADTIDALIGGASGTPGGFQGGGLIELGRGNDVLKGFGDGTFKGNEGTDTLILQDGTYTFTPLGNDLQVTATTGTGATMTINSFEALGGANSTAFTSLAGITAPTVFQITGGVVV
jgi:hypothetical protein